MNYSDYLTIIEVIWTVTALVGGGLALYLLRAERYDRALTVAENGRTGILSWALVTNESLRLLGQVVLLVVGLVSLITDNPSVPSTPATPVLLGLLVVFTTLAVAQSVVLIYARQRIARYPVAPILLAQQDTLLEVQRDMATSADVADLAHRATISEHRADVAEHRADASEGRADVAEKRADDAQARE